MELNTAALPHKYPMGAELRYTTERGGAILLKVIGQIARKNHAGLAVSYRCRQILNGQLLRDTLEIDECELALAGGDPETGRL